MKCITCEAEAYAVCKFCGRAVCRDHMQEKRYASGFTRFLGFVFRPKEKDGVVVPDAVWCGRCHPEYYSPV